MATRGVKIAIEAYLEFFTALWAHATTINWGCDSFSAKVTISH